MSVLLIWLSMWSSPACLANLSSESSFSSADLSELLLSSLVSTAGSVSLTSKVWTLVNGCNILGRPESESCVIWCQTPLYRQTGMAYLFMTLSLLLQNNWIG